MSADAQPVIGCTGLGDQGLPMAATLADGLRSRATERIFYREHAEAAPVLEIFRYQAFSADLDGCLDDQRVPEGEGVFLFKSARADYKLRLRGDGTPFSVRRHDGSRFLQRHGRLEFPGHDGVELLQHLGAEGTAAAIPELSKERFGRVVLASGVCVVCVDKDIGVYEGFHRS